MLIYYLIFYIALNFALYNHSKSPESSFMNFGNLLEEFQRQFREREAEYNQHQEEEETNDDFQSILENIIQSRGEAALRDLTRFNLNEFNQIYQVCEKSLSPKGRGRRSKLDPRDKLLITLTYLATGSKLAVMSSLFGKPQTSIYNILSSTINAIHRPLISRFFSMNTNLNENELHFRYFPNAVGAIDTTYIDISKPINRDEQRQNWSVKHGRCGVKIQALVRPNGLCTCFYGFIRGSVHDIAVFRSSNWLEQKLSFQTNLPNGAVLRSHYPVLFDKGYTGLQSQGYPEAIVTIRKPIGRELTAQEQQFNNNVESDRAIVENYFGRMKILFGIIANRYRGDRHLNLMYIIGICLSLTNFYNSIHPMRGNE